MGVTEYQFEDGTSLKVGDKDFMKLFKLVDDFVSIPKWHCRLVVPDIEVDDPSDSNCAIEPNSPMINLISGVSQDTCVTRIGRKRVWNKKRDCKKMEKKKTVQLKKRVNEGIPISRGKFGKEGLGSLFSGGRKTCSRTPSQWYLLTLALLRHRKMFEML